MINFYGERYKSRDIKCATTFDSNLVIGRVDGVIKIYDLDTKEERVLKGHSNTVTCLQVTIIKDFLISGSRDKTIIVWNLETYKQERVFKAEYEIFCLVLTSQYVFSGSLDDKVIRKWDYFGKNEILSGHRKGITCMKSTKNNNFLVSGSWDHYLKFWSTESSQELFDSDYASSQICQIEITEDTKYVVYSSVRHIYLLDFNKRVGIQVISAHGYFDINNASKCFVYNDYNKIFFKSIGSQAECKGILIKGNITAIACSSKNNLVYYGLDNNTVEIIDTKYSYNFAEFKNFDEKIYKMVLVGYNENYLASIIENGKIKIHQIYKENMQENIAIDYQRPLVKLTRDRKYLIIYENNSLSIWSYTEQIDALSNKNFTLVMKKKLKEFVWNVKISYDDKYFVLNQKDIIYMYSFQDMKEIAKFDLENEIKSTCISISKDNQLIIAGSEDGSITIFDVEKKCKISSLEGS